MKRISINNFDFYFQGYGHYSVSYTSPITGKVWSRTTWDMRLIDATKNAECPKLKDLNELKRFCKFS